MALDGILLRSCYQKIPCILNVRFCCRHNRLKVMIQKSRKISMGVPQFEITERPRTFNMLCILGKRHILLRQRVFLKLYEKYLSSFSLINLLLYNRLKNVSLFPVSCDRSSSLSFLTSK